MDNDIDKGLFRGLQEVSAGSFPKVCANCGRVYHDMAEFLANTVPAGTRSGLKAALDDDDRTVVELYRNCICGSTMMDFCQSRRDESAAGQRRREVFARTQAQLVARGMEPAVARAELLQLARGGRSELIEGLLKKGDDRKG